MKTIKKVKSQDKPFSKIQSAQSAQSGDLNQEPNLSPEEIKELESGSGPRFDACKGKKFGDRCSFNATTKSLQTGYCIYDKWGLTPGELFCAKADYKSKEEKK